MSSPRPALDCDAAIIGGGAAGLAAAAHITRAGFRVAVIEARDRLGGRIHTIRDHSLPLPIELGAEFIHGQPDSLLNIVHAAKLIPYDAEGDHWYFRGKKLQKFDEFWEEIEKVMHRLSRSRAARSPSFDESFADFISHCCRASSMRQAGELAISFVEGFDAAPSHRISAKVLAMAQASADESGGYESMRLIGGYDGVIEHLRSSIDARRSSFHLHTMVSTIEWKKGSVTIHSIGPHNNPNLPLRARCAVVTLPVGVLQAAPGADHGAVTFDPAIASKTAAANSLSMGHVVKVLIAFKSPFWETLNVSTLPRNQNLQTMSFLHGKRMLFPTWWSYYPLRSRVLVGWCGGPAARPLIGRTEEYILRQSLRSLSTILNMQPARLRSMVEKWWVCDWQSDPFARGAYSYVPVGALNAVKSLAAPVQQTLFFAGEATDMKTFGGTVESALLSGERAAREAIKCLSR